jgi:acyl carrier protein
MSQAPRQAFSSGLCLLRRIETVPRSGPVGQRYSTKSAKFTAGLKENSRLTKAVDQGSVPGQSRLALFRHGRPEVEMEEISKVVHGYILHEFLPGEDPAELTEQTPLITGGILDSITTLKLVVFLEEHFDITIEAHEAGVEHLDSIHQIAQLVAEKRQAA